MMTSIHSNFPVTSKTPLHQTKLCSLMTHPDPKSLVSSSQVGHDPNLSKLDKLSLKQAEAKRRYKYSFDEPLESSIDCR